MKRRLFYFTVMALLLSMMPSVGYAQDDPGATSDNNPNPCSLIATTTTTSEGDVTLCYQSQTQLGLISLTCGGDGLGYTSQHGENGVSGCVTLPCCGSNPLVINWTSTIGVNCHHVVTPGCCTGIDSDGDGVCDPDDCWPYDSNQSYTIGDSCDDGNPNTYGDAYDSNCNCIGYPGEGCHVGGYCDDGDPNTYLDQYDANCNCIGSPDPCTDSDGDGVCDPIDCWPNNSNLSHATGDSCDDGNPNTYGDAYDSDCNCVGTPEEGCHVGGYCNDGDPNTYLDQYDANCNCIGIPLPCGHLDIDDGCPLTVDGIDADCNVYHTPPNPDDGCPLTFDYFDAVNCVIVNEAPDVDDGCEGTLDVFNPYTCEITNEPKPCDDSDATTVGDKYDDDCECTGCDPCQMEGERWILLCELLNR